MEMSEREANKKGRLAVLREAMRLIATDEEEMLMEAVIAAQATVGDYLPEHLRM